MNNICSVSQVLHKWYKNSKHLCFFKVCMKILKYCTVNAKFGSGPFDPAKVNKV